MWRKAHVHRGIVVSSWNGFFRQSLGQARCQMRGGHLTALSCWSTRVQKNKCTGVQKYKSTEVEKFTKLYCSPSICEAFLVPCSGVLNCLKSYLSLETAQQCLSGAEMRGGATCFNFFPKDTPTYFNLVLIRGSTLRVNIARKGSYCWPKCVFYCILHQTHKTFWSASV